MVRRWGAGLLLVALGVALLPAAALGQDRSQGALGIVGGGLARTYEPWSLLVPLADLPRGFPSAQVQLPGLLEESEPRVGLFWNAANPGALPFEVQEVRSAFAASRENVSGDYHRPFDAGSESHTRAVAVGWRPLGSRGAGVASAVLNDASYADGVYSDVVRPYASSPYLVADTSSADLDQLSARLEAAGGWQLGPYGLGIGVGFQGQETRSVASPVPRLNHSAGPGVSGGVARAFSSGNVRLGVSGRWQSLNERTRVYTVAAPTRIYQIDGYAEAPPQDVSSLYERRLELEAWTYGGGIAGTARGADWALWGHRAGSKERWSNERIRHPRTDAWQAWSTTVGSAASGRVFGTTLVTATVRWTELDGQAEPAPSPDADDALFEDPAVFRADEEALDAALEIRSPLGDGRWVIAGVLTLKQEWRDREDSRVEAGSSLDMRAVGGSLEILRALTRGLAVSASGALLAYDPIGAIPNPAAMGPEYRRWAGPEMAILGTPTTTRHFSLGARWDPGAGRAFWLRLESTSVGPGDLETVLTLLPEGTRSTWRLSGGVTLRD